MKKITNKTLDDGMTYFEFILTALRRPMNPDAGTNYAEMEKVMPILKKVSNDVESDYILVEESDFQAIVDRLKNLPFQTNNELVFEMIEQVAGSETVNVTEN